MPRSRAPALIAASVACMVVCGGASAARRRARRAVSRPLPMAVVVPAAASAWDQTVAELSRQALAGRAGAVVAMDPHDGRVLAVVNPAYAVRHAYQPCSVFKIVVAIAGLTEGVITPETKIHCNGGCWLWPGHGPIDLRRALAVSCNPYFERVGERLGYDKVQRYAHLLGLGEPTGINLESESAGILPALVSPTAVGHLSSHAAGITTSAMQLAALVSAVVNGGALYQPQLAPARGFLARERWRLPAGTVLAGLADGFVGAVNEGSAGAAFDPDVVVAGKTGTCSRLGWFASYAPADDPRLVLVVFVRRGSGHTAAAIAGRIYQDLFKPPAPSQVGIAAGGH